MCRAGPGVTGDSCLGRGCLGGAWPSCHGAGLALVSAYARRTCRALVLFWILTGTDVFVFVHTARMHIVYI